MVHSNIYNIHNKNLEENKNFEKILKVVSLLHFVRKYIKIIYEDVKLLKSEVCPNVYYSFPNTGKSKL